MPTGNDSPFEKIKRINDGGNEYWSSRDFSRIKKAKKACFNSGHRIEDHFVDITEMIEIGKGGQRPVLSVYMSRYACYLIVQNADPGKEIVALGQTYFAVQTRKQEISEQEVEDNRRLLLRREMKVHNVRLAGAAKKAGVVKASDYAIFQNHGYMGLYGGLTAQDIHGRKRLKKGQQILNHMGSTELAANLFRATQTEEKLRRDNIKGKQKANRTHREVGKKVRQTIKELGGTMPENLPVADDIKKLETKQRKKLKDKSD